MNENHSIFYLEEERQMRWQVVKNSLLFNFGRFPILVVEIILREGEWWEFNNGT
jgi:hypothetical protein